MYISIYPLQAGLSIIASAQAILQDMQQCSLEPADWPSFCYLDEVSYHGEAIAQKSNAGTQKSLITSLALPSKFEKKAAVALLAC